jgi:hypothetical protein
LDALALQAWQLEPPMPHEIPRVLRPEAAVLIDGLLARVARGRGALEVAMGEALAALAEGDRALRLGYSGIGDYARERLGIAGRTALAMARLARELRERPLLREAVRRGEVSARKAEAVLPVARGEVEAQWVARARAETVRALEAATLAAGTAGNPGQEDEEWERICVPLSPEGRAKVDEAMALAGKLLGAAAPRWQRLEALCQEFIGAHPCEAPGGVDGPNGEPLAGPATCQEGAGFSPEWLEALEAETQRWAALEAVEPVAAPAVDEGEIDPCHLDEELRRLGAMRDRWDELIGHLGMLLRMRELWRELGFTSFAHYCTERLGMAARTVEQRASLERRLHVFPALRRAMREGRLSYEKARLVAGCADHTSVDAWIERAEGSTCIALKREIEAREETQMCARGELTLRVPRRVGLLVGVAFLAARKAAGRWLAPGECLERVAEHFIDTWKASLTERSTPQKRVLARDGSFCQVPGCSRAAAHAHHVLYRSLGGGDEGENLVGLCAAHHLHGVHRGWVRVRGRAPDGLTWELGAGAG